MGNMFLSYKLCYVISLPETNVNIIQQEIMTYYQDFGTLGNIHAQNKQ